MGFIPESLRRQNETIRALQTELDNQKWVFEQFLRSPSWRLTAPGRWVARQLRALSGKATSDSGPVSAADQPASADAEQFKRDPSLAALYETALQCFLVSEADLNLPTSDAPEVSIIVVLFNRAELALACLRSIAEYRGAPAEVIIVDNASTDATPLLLDRTRGARIIRNRENAHFLRAVNQAAKHARGEALVLLNSDAQLLPGSLDAALRTLRSATNVGAVGGKLIFFDGMLQEAGSAIYRDGSCFGYGRGDIPFSPQYMFRRDVDYCSGAFLVTRRDLWEALGGFDETFAPAYYEETDYCMRLWERGLRVVYEPAATVVHHEFASSSSVKSAIRLQQEHQRLFVERHRPALETREAPGAGRELWARSAGRAPRALLLDDRTPHRWLGSGFPRAHAILDALVRDGYFVTLYPLTLTNEDWAAIYADIPREVEVINEAGPRMLELFLKVRRGYYDVIIVSRPHNMEFIQPILAANAEWFAGTGVIYDAEALFVAREASLRALQGSPMPNEQVLEGLHREIGTAAGADVVVAVSESDRAALVQHGVRRAAVLGHSLEPRLTRQSFEERAGILFVGAVHEENSPNGDSLIWFLTEILPRVRTTLGMDVAVMISGVNKSDRIRELAVPPTRHLGQVPDLSGLYGQSRVFVAPTRYGAGVPHKVHEAASRGLPVVATSLLAGQLGWGGREMAIADTAEEFAARIVEVYEDVGRWSSLREAAFERASRECSPETFEANLREILRTVRSVKQVSQPRG